MIKRLIPPPHAPSWPLRVLYELADVICPAIIALALALTFAVRPTGVFGVSMEPTLHHGQQIVLLTLSELRHGDVVVVSEAAVEGSENFVKRVIGLPGDVIDINFETGVVYRNGEALHEPFTAGPTHRPGDIEFPVAVAPGTVFLLGDNRNNSLDSRHACTGLVDQRFVIGRMVWPQNHID